MRDPVSERQVPLGQLPLYCLDPVIPPLFPSCELVVDSVEGLSDAVLLPIVLVSVLLGLEKLSVSPKIRPRRFVASPSESEWSTSVRSSAPQNRPLALPSARVQRLELC